MTELTPGLYPPGGWFFEEKDGTRFEANQFSQLVHMVWSYRRRLKRPEGNPFREIQEAICARSPHICREAKGPASTYAEPALPQSVADTAGRWLSERTKGRLRLSSLEEASRRATVCARCPHRINWKDGCTPCDEMTGTIIKAVVAPNVPMQFLAGYACQFAKDDLSAAVFMTEGPTLRDAPNECWRKSRS